MKFLLKFSKQEEVAGQQTLVACYLVQMFFASSSFVLVVGSSPGFAVEASFVLVLGSSFVPFVEASFVLELGTSFGLAVEASFALASDSFDFGAFVAVLEVSLACQILVQQVS